jgi:hypothetical protein
MRIPVVFGDTVSAAGTILNYQEQKFHGRKLSAMFGLVLLSFCPSLLAGLLFGIRGVLAAFAVEIALVSTAFVLMRADTGMEGLAFLLCLAIVVVENMIVAIGFAWRPSAAT